MVEKEVRRQAKRVKRKRKRRNDQFCKMINFEIKKLLN
jgi:hypothetical protein